MSGSEKNEKVRDYLEEMRVSHEQELAVIARRDEADARQHERRLAQLAKESEYDAARDKATLERLDRAQAMLTIVMQMASTLQTNAYAHEQAMLKIKCDMLRELKPDGLSVSLHI